MAGSQTAGRGQGSNKWQSESLKNLTISILLNPCFMDLQRQFDLNIAVSLAINDVLSGYFAERASIKWPNDSYIDNLKIGGTLIENLVQGNKIKHAIIGIGLNINQVNFHPNLQNATSFKKILHADYDLETVKNEICSAIEARYLQLKAGKTAELRLAYISRLYLRDVWAEFIIDNTRQKARICSVSYEGCLLVETEKGMRQFRDKEIAFYR